MPKKVPAYCLHKATRQAYVKIDGHRIYLGKHGTQDSHKRYSDEIAKWQQSQEESTQNVTVGQLTLLFLKRCESHYVKDGKVTSEVSIIQIALRHLNRLYRDTPADGFTPMKLAMVRKAMIETKTYVRASINRYVNRIVRCFKWAVSQGLVKVTTYQALTTLQGLQAGRCDAKESEPVLPVELADVEAVLPHLSTPLQGVVRFQLATAARSSEALRLRLADIDRTGDVWMYRPRTHKAQHQGKSRVILLGPRAQAIVQEHIRIADPEAYLFAVAGTGKPYRRDTYCTAIRRACEVAFGMPKELRGLKRNAAADLKAQAAEWRKAHCWHPHQLRHRAATDIRKAADVEASKTILGHADLRTTELYAERDLAKAAEIIKRIG